MIKNQKFSAVVLAAGLSERMGKDKMLLLWQNKSFVEHIIEGYINCDIYEVIVVLNKNNYKLFNNFSFENKNVKTVLNKFPEKGRFYSLQTGLMSLSCLYPCFIHNVDNPYVEKAVIENMKDILVKNNYVVPAYNNRKGHPILLSKSLIEHIIQEKKVDINIRLYLNQYEFKLCEVFSDRILENINNNEDYKRFLKK